MQHPSATNSSILVLSNHYSDFQSLLKLLSYYFPSNKHTSIHLDTKYYQADVEIIRQEWPHLQTLQPQASPSENINTDDKQDLLIMLANSQESFPAQLYDLVINKYNPENLILIVNTKNKTEPWGDEEKIANEVNNFIEIIKQDLEAVIQDPPQPDNYEDGNIFNLLELIQTTPWSHITRKHFEKNEKQPKVETLQVNEAKVEQKQQKKEEKVEQLHKEGEGEMQEMTDEQLQSEMIAFESLMGEMQLLRDAASQPQKMSDDDRKRRAEDLMKKLVGAWM